MYARFQTTLTPPPGDPAEGFGALFDLISDHPGFAGAWGLPPIAAYGGGPLTLWQTRDDAELASERTAAVRGPRPMPIDSDVIYEVAADLTAAEPDAVPTYAQLTYFDAPRTEEWSDAMQRAGRERIWPAVRDVPGTVRTLVLVGDGNAQLVIGFATAIEAIEEAQRRIMSTALLPWEDPAMLTGPDRVALHRVAAVRLPATV